MNRGFYYGDLDPERFYIDRNVTWIWAVREFLWDTPGKRETHKELAQSYWFNSWCDWLGGWVGSVRHSPQGFPTLEQHLANLVEDPAAPDGGLRAFADLQDLYAAAWKGMIERDIEPATWSLMLESGSIPSAARQAGRGMEFCLMILLFRYGRCSARVRAVEGRTLAECVTWEEAREASSFLLAISVLNTAKRFNEAPRRVPWPEVLNRAKEREKAIINGHDSFIKTDLSDVRETPPREGIEGFKKLLAATLGDGEWGAVKKLAAAFEMQGRRTIDDWAKRERIDNWFPVGAATARKHR